MVTTHGFDGLILATLIGGGDPGDRRRPEAGNLIALVPEPVINGFTIGIAAIIALSQVPDALGIVLPEGTPAETLERHPGDLGRARYDQLGERRHRGWAPSC